jgi:hypothetical protein
VTLLDAVGLTLASIAAAGRRSPAAQPLADTLLAEALTDGVDADTQLRRQTELVSLLAANEPLCQATQATLKRLDRQALELGAVTAIALSKAPDGSAIVEAVVCGRWAVHDLLATQLPWWEIPYSISHQQAVFLASRTPLCRFACPEGGEDLGFTPDSTGNVHYRDRLGNKVDPFTFEEGMYAAPRPQSLLKRKPSGLTLVRAAHLIAHCAHGHEWPLFLPRSAPP